MGIKILVPVKRSTKLHKNEDQASAILKGISDIIKENNNTDQMIAWFTLRRNWLFGHSISR